MFTLPLSQWMSRIGKQQRRGVAFRALEHADVPALAVFLLSLSVQTCALRYHSPRRFDPAAAEAEALQIVLRGRRGVALGAYDPAQPTEILGVVELVVDRTDPSTGEMALVIRDSHQGRGIGTLLTQRAVQAAQQLGVVALRASTFAENMPMRQILERLGRAAPIGYADGVLELHVTLGPEDPRLRWAA